MPNPDTKFSVPHSCAHDKTISSSAICGTNALFAGPRHELTNHAAACLHGPLGIPHCSQRDGCARAIIAAPLDRGLGSTPDVAFLTKARLEIDRVRQLFGPFPIMPPSTNTLGALEAWRLVSLR